MVCTVNLIRYLHSIHYIGFASAQLMNSILVFLIVTRSKNSLGSYRHSMLIFTLASMAYSWVEIIGQPVSFWAKMFNTLFLTTLICSGSTHERLNVCRFHTQFVN